MELQKKQKHNLGGTMHYKLCTKLHHLFVLFTRVHRSYILSFKKCFRLRVEHQNIILKREIVEEVRFSFLSEYFLNQRKKEEDVGIILEEV